MWISSPPMASHRANAIVVFPVPLGPVNRKAALRGLREKLARIRFCLSRPINSAMALGRYFSASGVGKANEGALTGAPPERSRRPSALGMQQRRLTVNLH